MKMIAAMAAVAAVAGVLLKLFGNVQLGTPFLVTGMSTLTIVAFMLGYLIPYPAKDDEAVLGGLRTMWKFAMTLTGYALAVAIMGLKFWVTGTSCGFLWLCFRVCSAAPLPTMCFITGRTSISQTVWSSFRP